MKCPICKKEVDPKAGFSPFCSDRCRLIDLANWSDGKYVISSPAATAADHSVEAEPGQVEPEPEHED